ncbi:hypothetical protein HDU97_006027 [Phlyctochytrium planicorne]|nr:hypothetical protein HDU97_006027 [Phlyctochytrium planicorne]
MEVEALEEIEVLRSIYGDDVVISGDSVNCGLSLSLESEEKAQVILSLPNDYPSASPPVIREIRIPPSGLPFPIKTKEGVVITYESCTRDLRSECDSLFQAGEVVIFAWLDLIEQKLKDLYADHSISLAELEAEQKAEQTSEDEDTTDLVEVHEEFTSPPVCTIMIHVGKAPIVDRRSVFQGFCAVVKNTKEVDEVCNSLRSNGKIARCTHLIWAYRIQETLPGSKDFQRKDKLKARAAATIVKQDCDDDGEDAAGGRLLHLLQTLDVFNVIVLVARWYGGIKLGPARFKLINQAGRDALDEAGLLKK